jgi:hypothetical protein
MIKWMIKQVGQGAIVAPGHSHVEPLLAVSAGSSSRNCHMAEFRLVEELGMAMAAGSVDG